MLNLESAWPKRMVWSTSSTFKQWFVTDENAQATRFCERVVDRPGSSLNPLFIHAAPQAGCSHLIHATGQALLRREEGHVLHITAADATLQPLETAWGDALSGATALMVDDVHDFAHRETWSHQLGVLLDQALNHGLQVVVGSRDAPDDLPPSRLKDVLRASSVVNLRPPQPGSLLAFGRWRCAQKPRIGPTPRSNHAWSRRVGGPWKADSNVFHWRSRTALCCSMATMRPSFWKVIGHSHQQVSNSGWTISPLNSLAMRSTLFIPPWSPAAWTCTRHFRRGKRTIMFHRSGTARPSGEMRRCSSKGSGTRWTPSSPVDLRA